MSTTLICPEETIKSLNTSISPTLPTMKPSFAAIFGLAGAVLVSAAPTLTASAPPESTGLTLPPEALAFLEEFKAFTATRDANGSQPFNPQPDPPNHLEGRAPRATRRIDLDTWVRIFDEEFWDTEQHDRDQPLRTLLIGADYGQTVWDEFEARAGGELRVEVKNRFNLITSSTIDMTILMTLYEGISESTGEINGYFYGNKQLLQGAHDVFDYTVHNTVEGGEDAAKVFYNIWNILP